MPKAQGLKMKSVRFTGHRERHRGEGGEQVTLGNCQGGEIAIKKTGPEPRGEI